MSRILALDLGKFKTVACVFTPADGSSRFITVETTVDHLTGLITREAPTLVVFETCTIAGWVHDLCLKLGTACQVANPNGEGLRWRNVKRKTDRDDAVKLARLAAAGELPTVAMPSPAERQKRSLLHLRQGIVRQRVGTQNALRALVEAQGLRLASGHRAWTAVGLTLLRSWAKPLAECGPDELWRGQADLLISELAQSRERETQVDAALERMAVADERVRRVRTVPGIGRVTAEAIVNYLGDGRRFRTAGQVGSYAGLVPTQYQSGQSDRRGRVSKRGPGLLRKLLVEASWVMLRYNEWAAAFVKRVSRGQKTRRKQAVVALARKVLIRCWAMLRDGTDWQTPTPSMAA